MVYNFYEKEALKHVPLNFLNFRFGISESDYNELIMENDLDSALLFHLLTKQNLFDIIRDYSPEYDYGCEIYKKTPKSVLNALYYDREYHPDEVCFVTTDKEVAKIANKYFGEDSIKIIK